MSPVESIGPNTFTYLRKEACVPPVTPDCGGPRNPVMKQRPVIYLSGPDRLLPDGKERMKKAAELCDKYGFDTVPVPDTLFIHSSSREEGIALAKERLAGIASCDLIIADTRDFRDLLEPYGETSMELGYAWGMGKKLYCYMKDARSCADRYPGTRHKNEKDFWVDENGISFEPGPLNLMLVSPSTVVEGGLEEALKAASADFFGKEA